jgi:apolipoprotein N-acyltransferase
MKTFGKDVFWLLVSFGLWAASFHPLDLWPLAWVAMVPAFVRLLAADAGRPRLGLAWVVAQYWLHASLMAWTSVIAPPLAFLVPLLGVPFSWLTGFLLDRAVVRLRMPLIFAAPLVIVLVEVLRDQALLGLSWASIGYSQWRWLDLVQLAAAGRVHLVSLVVLVVNAAIAQAIVRRRLAPLLVAAVVVGLGWGAGRLLRPADLAPGPLAAGLQPSIPQRERMATRDAWRDKLVRNLAIHRDLLDQVRGLEPDLLVWSETSFPRTEEPKVTLEQHLGGTWRTQAQGSPQLSVDAKDLVLRGKDQVTILGLIRGRILPEEGRGGPRDDDEDGIDETNVAWVLRGGVPTDVTYTKRGLAPFGEFNPWPRGVAGRAEINRMIEQSAGYIPDLSPGEGAVLFDCPSPGGVRKGGLTICFEIVFPWYYRETARLGGDFHVNISNDAWFDGSSELELVDVAALFRAVETGRTLLRVSNSGISTLLDPGGRRLAVVEDAAGRRTQVRGSLHGRIPISSALTPYVRWADWPWILPGLALLAGLVAATIRAKRVLPGVSLR